MLLLSTKVKDQKYLLKVKHKNKQNYAMLSEQGHLKKGNWF